MESLSSANTRSIIYDVSKLDAPRLLHFFRSTEQAIDHNNYVFNIPGSSAEFISQVDKTFQTYENTPPSSSSKQQQQQQLPP
jgi:hypothetical protein